MTKKNKTILIICFAAILIFHLGTVKVSFSAEWFLMGTQVTVLFFTFFLVTENEPNAKE